jgi:hypothetical protein
MWKSEKKIMTFVFNFKVLVLVQWTFHYIMNWIFKMYIGHHFESFTVGNRDLVDRYRISVSYNTADVFHLSQALRGPFFVHDLYKNTN